MTLLVLTRNIFIYFLFRSAPCFHFIAKEYQFYTFYKQDWLERVSNSLLMFPILCFSYGIFSQNFSFSLLLQCDMDKGKVIGLNLNSPGHELSHIRIIN